MKIAIIEDEFYTSKDLESCIKELRPTFEVVKILPSVKEALHYFKSKPQIDLIFSDIQLQDGLSFEIFQKVELTVPVIFCTAFDAYAIDAFKANAIDYLLKPISNITVRLAIEKYERLVKPSIQVNESIRNLLASMEQSKPDSASHSLLVHYKDKIIPLRLEEVALFYIQNENYRLLNFDGSKYSINENLEEIEKICGPNFFRINRQFLVNRKAVSELVQHFSRKYIARLCLPFEEKIVLGKEKTTAFLQWLKKV